MPDADRNWTPQWTGGRGQHQAPSSRPGTSPVAFWCEVSECRSDVNGYTAAGSREWLAGNAGAPGSTPGVWTEKGAEKGVEGGVLERAPLERSSRAGGDHSANWWHRHVRHAVDAAIVNTAAVYDSWDTMATCKQPQSRASFTLEVRDINIVTIKIVF